MSRLPPITLAVARRLFAEPGLEEPAPLRTPSCAVPDLSQRYSLLGKLGEGAMGSVHRAYDAILKREVAMKRLLRLGSRDEDRSRFMREASLAARLSHPHIVSVYDVGTWNGEPCYTMELVEGTSLETWIGGDPREIARVGAQVARSLHFAHENGVVHRDIKPSNVLVARDGRAVVTDFGVAREVASPGLTQSGQIIGTPEYMSPEQALGQTVEIDARTDVCNLGATLYHLLTGRPPHTGRTVAAAIDSVLRREPALPRAVRPEVPRELEAIVVRAMEKDRRRRYPTAEALAEDLEAFLAGRPITALPMTPRRRVVRALRLHRGRVVVTTLLLACVALGAAAWLGPRPDPSQERLLRAERQAAGARAITSRDRLDERRRGLEEAATLARAAQGPGSGSLPARRLLARVDLELGAYDTAVAELEALQVAGEADAAFDLARAHFRSALCRFAVPDTGDLAGVTPRATKWCKHVAQSATGVAVRAQAALFARLVEGGFNAWDDPLALPGGDLSPEGCFANGFIYDLLGDHAAAEQFLRRAVSLDPLFGEAWHWLAGVLLEGGRLEEAESIAGMATRLGRPDLGVNFQMIRAAARIRAGDTEGAVKVFAGTDLSRIPGGAPLEVAVAHLLAGRPEEAIAFARPVEEVEAVDPACAVHARYVCACALCDLARRTGDDGPLEEAAGELARALEIASTNDLFQTRPGHGWPEEGFSAPWKRSNFFFPLFLTRVAVATDPLLAPLRARPLYAERIAPLLQGE